MFYPEFILKKINYLWVIVFIFTFIISGCGKKEVKVDKSKKEEKPKIRILVPEVRDKVTDILPQKGKVWFTTDKSGLFVFDIKSNQLRNYNIKNSLVPSNHLNSICADPLGGFWVGGKGGLAYWNGSKFASKYDLGEVYAIKAGMRNGIRDIWVGTVVGLQHLEGSMWKVYNKHNSGLMDEEVLCVEFGEGESIWCGGNMGLHQFFPSRKYWQQYTGPHKVYRGGSLEVVPGNCGLPANQIYSLHWTGEKLWIATNGGVGCFFNGSWIAYTADHKEFMLENEKQKMIHVPGNSPLSGNWIDDIKYNPKRKELYIATDQGVSILSDDGKWKYLNKDNTPCITDKIKCVDYDDKFLYIGTYYGLLIYEF